ncbi:MAG: hypothetical protein ACOC8Q_02355 [Desulfosalsimonas sp.]
MEKIAKNYFKTVFYIMVSKIHMVWVAVFFLAGIYSSAADSREPYYAPSYKTPGSYRSYSVSDSIDIQMAENELIGIMEEHNEYSWLVGQKELKE